MGGPSLHVGARINGDYNQRTPRGNLPDYQYQPYLPEYPEEWIRFTIQVIPSKRSLEALYRHMEKLFCFALVNFAELTLHEYYERFSAHQSANREQQ